MRNKIKHHVNYALVPDKLFSGNFGQVEVLRLGLSENMVSTKNAGECIIMFPQNLLFWELIPSFSDTPKYHSYQSHDTNPSIYICIYIYPLYIPIIFRAFHSFPIPFIPIKAVKSANNSDPCRLGHQVLEKISEALSWRRATTTQRWWRGENMLIT